MNDTFSNPGLDPAPQLASTPDPTVAKCLGEAAEGDIVARNDPRSLLDDLVLRAVAYNTGTEVKDLFDFMRRFPHLAPFNAMLLHVQNPGIRFALRARDWCCDYGRRIKPGTRPYVILWTMGPVAFVFDISDTEPIDPLKDRVPQRALNPFPAKGEPPPKAMQLAVAASLKMGVIVEFQDFATNLAGRVERVRRKNNEFTISLNSKQSAAQNLGTLAHELAHVLCGHLGPTEFCFNARRGFVAHAAREFEAEAVAYLVTERLGLDIGSVSYMASYVKEGNPLPNYSLDAILKAASAIEDMVAGRFIAKSRPNAHSRPDAIHQPESGNEDNNQQLTGNSRYRAQNGLCELSFWRKRAVGSKFEETTRNRSNRRESDTHGLSTLLRGPYLRRLATMRWPRHLVSEGETLNLNHGL